MMPSGMKDDGGAFKHLQRRRTVGQRDRGSSRSMSDDNAVAQIVRLMEKGPVSAVPVSVQEGWIDRASQT
jgi:hypothetical protein